MAERNQIGIKIGSQITAIACRNEEGKIDVTHIKTCVRYSKGFVKKDSADFKVGEAAAEYDDAIFPLELGDVETEDGVKQLIDILNTMQLHSGASMVLASPAVQMKEGNDRLAQAIKQVCKPQSLTMFSEGLCSAVHLSDMDFINKSAIFSLNLGSSTTEIGCFNEGNEIHLSAHPEACGNRVDKEIAKRVGNLVGDAIVSIKRIREMKEDTSLIDPKTYTVEGMTRHGKKEAQVSDEIILPLKEYAENVAAIFCGEVTGAVNTTIRNMALKSPLFISGGMSNIPGMPELIGNQIYEKMHHRFEICCSQGKDNHLTAAKGALLIAEE
ncbi:MAG: cell division FtsA domain-containing protein (plasmid) [Candidatus Methanoperedens sp.]|nr:MAG: cell division FtsA domain-containing protein [Candidatus Methanoperedens sp.]